MGCPNTATYGQTITAPLSDPILTSFSFELNLPATDTFKGYVFAWNGASVTGSALFTSPLISTLGTGFQLVTINTGPLALTPGGSYVVAISASEVPTSSGIGYAGIRLDTDSYSGGNFVFLNNGTDTSQWTTVSWSTIFAPADDLAFKATFVPIPEPSALAIGLTGLAAATQFVAHERRRSSRRRTPQSGP